MNGKFVAYFRVSTKGQGESGLGLEAQRTAVLSYLNGGEWELIAEFEEVESGKRSDRPQLQAALDLCRLTGAKLVIAKLDRLSRNSAFLNNLLEAGVPFVCCDMPEADAFMVRIMAALAQKERELISARTKASLATIRDKIARGEEYVSRASGKRVTGLGGFRGVIPDHTASVAARAAKADAFAESVAPMIRLMRGSGASFAKIAGALNAQHIKTAYGSTWTPTAVKRVLDRTATPDPDAVAA